MSKAQGELWNESSRPNHRGRKMSYSDGQHRSCWDCEHLRLTGGFGRICRKHQEWHMFAPGPISYQVREYGESYDDCPDFDLIRELRMTGCIVIWGERPA